MLIRMEKSKLITYIKDYEQKIALFGGGSGRHVWVLGKYAGTELEGKYSDCGW